MDERDRFESWALAHGHTRGDLLRDPDGSYRWALFQQWWFVWQARAALCVAGSEGDRPLETKT